MSRKENGMIIVDGLKASYSKYPRTGDEGGRTRTYLVRKYRHK